MHMRGIRGNTFPADKRGVANGIAWRGDGGDRVAAAARKALADGLLTESEAYEFTKES